MAAAKFCSVQLLFCLICAGFASFHVPGRMRVVVPKGDAGNRTGNRTGNRAVSAANFTQKLDHFANTTTTPTWQQRWWSSDAYYRPGGPVFFMLGGEVAQTPAWLVADATWTKLAQQEGAYLFLAEHRFYGQSRPTADMSVQSLRYLSAWQAVEDYAAMIRAWRVQFPQLANAKWVTFGGSYPGALSAWMRRLHPDLVHAAVASSGPIQAEFDFVEYMEVVEASIASYSQSCADSVKAGFAAISSLVKTAAGRHSLQTTFNLCSPIDPNDKYELAQLFFTLYDIYMNIVQYSGNNVEPYTTVLTIENAICRFHDSSSLSVLAKMQMTTQFYNNLTEPTASCLSTSYRGLVDYLAQSRWGVQSDDRGWRYQCCSEFGFFQSTDSSTAASFWGQTVGVDYFTQMCSDVFGSQFTPQLTQSAVQQTNAYFGGRDNLGSSNIVLPDGIIDPWHALGKLNSTDSTIVPVLIAQGAHCADMYDYAADEPQSLTSARTQIMSTVSQFLKLN